MLVTCTESGQWAQKGDQGEGKVSSGFSSELALALWRMYESIETMSFLQT